MTLNSDKNSGGLACLGYKRNGNNRIEITKWNAPARGSVHWELL